MNLLEQVFNENINENFDIFEVNGSIKVMLHGKILKEDFADNKSAIEYVKSINLLRE